MRYLLFGTGEVALQAKRQLEDNHNIIVAFADNNSEQWNKTIEGIRVIAPKEILNVQYDVIGICAFKAAKVIKEQLLSMGIPEQQIDIPILPPAVIFPNPIYDGSEDLESVDGTEEISENTKSFLNDRLIDKDAIFENKIEQLKKTLLDNCISRNKVCIVSGGVLQAYGLRKSLPFDDLDIIMTSELRDIYGSGLVIVSDSVEMHKQNQEIICDNDIINNPENHFIYQGMKFMTLQLLCEGKKRTGENSKKIVEEIAVIESFFNRKQ